MIAADDLRILRSIERKLLWLSTWMVHHANFVRPNDGTKIGGHQASASSVVSLMTALYFRRLGPGDIVATKAHGSPVFYAAQYLRGRLRADALPALRQFGGLQAYPSRRKNPEVVDLSTGSMGLGAVQATFGALATRYLRDHGMPAGPERFIVMVGDAELDEGNVWEALLEEPLGELGNVLWIVDVNRQSLDRVVPDTRRTMLPAMFRAAGWRVVELRWGTRLSRLFAGADGQALRRRLERMPVAEYHRLLRLAPGAIRKAVVTVAGGDVDAAVDRALASVPDDDLSALMADVGGHDLEAIDGGLEEATRSGNGPAIVFADTIKGYGLPLAADPMNHTTLLAPSQIEAFRTMHGVRVGEEWAGFAPDSPEARYIERLPPLFSAPRPGAAIDLPPQLDETYANEISTQEAFGRVLGTLGRGPAGDRVVTVSADVAVTTHLAGWINRKGVYYPEARASFAEGPQAVVWKESPAGQHIEIGIAEHNLFLLLGAFGLTREVSGETLLPIGTLYDPFVPRGLDALYHALYSGSRFVVAATPSGVTLSPEGGAHQSVITPGIGIALPGIAYFEPAFAREVEWILLHALAQIAAGRGDSLYLRLSTRPIDQRLAPPPGDEYREQVLRGGYRLLDGRTRPGWDPETAVHVFVAGVLATEAVDASRRLEAEGMFPSVFVVTSPDRLYRSTRETRPWLLDLVTPEEEDVPVVSALDGHSHGLSFLGSALGVPQIALGVDDFGQSGARADLYRHYGIDADAIVRAALTLTGR